MRLYLGTQFIRGCTFEAESIRGCITETDFVRVCILETEIIRGCIIGTEFIRGCILETEFIRGCIIELQKQQLSERRVCGQLHNDKQIGMNFTSATIRKNLAQVNEIVLFEVSGLGAQFRLIFSC